MDKFNRLFDILTYYQQHPRACMVVGKKDGEWIKYSTDDFVSTVNNLSKALIAKGFQKGDKIALMSGNRPEWNMVDFACNQLGIAIVPLYPTLSAQDLAYILNDSETKMIFVSNAELAQKVDEGLDAHQLSIELYTLDAVVGRKHYSDLIAL